MNQDEEDLCESNVKTTKKADGPLYLEYDPYISYDPEYQQMRAAERERERKESKIKEIEGMSLGALSREKSELERNLECVNKKAALAKLTWQERRLLGL